ncbi:RNA polymerase sigma factor [Acidaminobacter sp. JC074]|uniref:RNA polymerase sigma factor n=1 Tax=Acidaminobacter sp. JC074 TaxID=2530199 RepID=UPI001F0F8524|nr:RNA polymerase sigma factor [Acidaminobacter sp. JC074]MCH4889488.1 RNA polymerase sigma factor [Acidaminobacter sp. JC074]
MVEETFIMSNEETYRIIIQTYQQQIFSYIYKMVKCKEDAEDLTQETFLKVFKKLDSLREPSLVKSWLYQIAYRTVVNHIKKQKLKSFSLFTNPDSINDLVYESNDETYSEKAIQIFATLDHKEHTLLTLRVVEEMSYDEISLIMGKSSATLRKRYERLIKRLRSDFEEVAHEEDN